MKQGQWFRVPIYGVKVRVYEGDPGRISKELNFVFEPGHETEIDTCDGAVFDHGNGTYTFIVVEKATIGRVISHEVYHLTTQILSYVGVRQTPEGNEAHAYLLGFLMDKILKLLNR